MGAPNPNDGTALGTGEVISDEFVDPSTGARRDPNLPVQGYKIPRSKIVVGPYGQDGGDATADAPLAVESRAERLYLEQQALRDRERSVIAMQSRQAERAPLTDARGGHMDTRGQR